jgi:hypothetical protein
VLRPILVGKDTRIPDYVVLISTLGGLAIFGINGFVIGPVIAAMFIAVWGMFSMSRPGLRAAGPDTGAREEWPESAGATAALSTSTRPHGGEPTRY